jgi:biotin operon repressor
VIRRIPPDRPPLLSSFRRVSVADQASAALRQAIEQGALSDPLPGEHQLARQLGISRSSLRTALAQLRAEGLVISRNGRRARLNSSRRPAPTNTPPVVCVVCPVSREIIIHNQHPIVMEMHANCATKGIGWEEAFDARLDGPHPDRHLRQLVSGRKHVCWILLACPGPIQRWFARAGIPAFVLGSCLPGVDLPSIDVDYRAVGWHAAGIIIKRGHLQIGLLRPRRPLAGDLAAYEGFLSYIARGPAGVSITTILVDSNPAAFRAKLDRLAKSHQRPTALFSNRLAYTVSAMFHLLQLGLRVPNDISLVMGDSHSVIDTALPELTRYHDISLAHADRAVRIAQALLAGHHVPLKPSLFIPTFIAGSTLGAPPQVRRDSR